MGSAPSAALRNAAKSSEEAGAPNPSDDVFRDDGNTYVAAVDPPDGVRQGGARRRSLPRSLHQPSAGGGTVADHVYRLTEVVGSSETSVADAIRTAVRKASQTVRNIEWFEAKEIRGQVVDGEVAYFQVTVKLGFRVD
jgi:flavin-binding protein dodecin